MVLQAVIAFHRDVIGTIRYISELCVICASTDSVSYQCCFYSCVSVRREMPTDPDQEEVWLGATCPDMFSAVLAESSSVVC